MTEAQEQLQKYKKVLGGFSNPRPRDVDTPENLNAQIDKVVQALDAIRPERVEVEVEMEVTTDDEAPTLDLTSTDDDPPAAETKTRKRKKRKPNRQHEGGRDREG